MNLVPSQLERRLNGRSIHMLERRFGLFQLGVQGDGYARIELELDIRSLVPRVLNPPFMKARRASSPVKCRGEIEEMMKVDIKKVVGAFEGLDA